MLKLKKNDEDIFFVSERIGFKKPVYITDDEWSGFREMVFSYSDMMMIKSLTPPEREDGKVTDENLENEEKIKAIKDSLLYTSPVSSYSKAVKSFAMGIGHAPCHAVPADFIELYKVSGDYANKYINAENWDDERKADFQKVRAQMTETFKAIMGVDFNIKFSAKAVNLYLNSYMVTKNRNTGKKSAKETATKVVTIDIYTAFKEFMKAVNIVTGVSTVGKVTMINTF